MYVCDTYSMCFCLLLSGDAYRIGDWVPLHHSPQIVRNMMTLGIYSAGDSVSESESPAAGFSSAGGSWGNCFISCVSAFLAALFSWCRCLEGRSLFPPLTFSFFTAGVVDMMKDKMVLARLFLFFHTNRLFALIINHISTKNTFVLVPSRIQIVIIVNHPLRNWIPEYIHRINFHSIESC